MKDTGFTHESSDAQSVEWYTPKWIFDALRTVFDLDPCHPKNRLPWVPVRGHYWLEIDGLSLPWAGNVWLNPPYGRETSVWLEKMNAHRNGVALVFARTDCKWFHDFAAKADALLFLRGRVRFVDGNGKTGGGGAGAGSMLIAWGAENVAALKQMETFGFLVKNRGEEYEKQ